MGISEKEKVRAEKIRIRISKINWIFNVFSVKNQLNDYFNFNYLEFINFFMIISINILFSKFTHKSFILSIFCLRPPRREAYLQSCRRLNRLPTNHNTNICCIFFSLNSFLSFRNLLFAIRFQSTLCHEFSAMGLLFLMLKLL